jgi:hypothetical protein
MTAGGRPRSRRGAPGHRIDGCRDIDRGDMGKQTSLPSKCTELSALCGGDVRLPTFWPQPPESVAQGRMHDPALTGCQRSVRRLTYAARSARVSARLKSSAVVIEPFWPSGIVDVRERPTDWQP